MYHVLLVSVNKIVSWTVKAILRDVMGEEKFYFSLFFIIQLCNDPCCLSVFVLGSLRNMEYCPQHVLPFNATL